VFYAVNWLGYALAEAVEKELLQVGAEGIEAQENREETP